MRLKSCFPLAVMRDRAAQIAMAVLVAQIPFELRFAPLGLSNLQWTFIAAALLSAPLLLEHWRTLRSDRLIQAAAVFVATQWLAAVIAPEFHANAFKGALRFTAGFLLLIIVRAMSEPKSLLRAWAVVSGIAALYALFAYAGFGVPDAFRTQEFYIGQIQRLSGSFEYPNTAAVFFGM